MSKLQISLIVLSGIFISFFLFARGEKYIMHETDYGQIVNSCSRETGPGVSFQSCLSRRGGRAYWEIQDQADELEAFVMIPCVILITAIFIGLSVNKKEILLTMLTLTPLIVSLLGYRPVPMRAEIAPYYALCTFMLAWTIRRLKRRLYFR